MSEAPVPAKTWPDVLAPFSDLMKTLFGPALEQYGLAWGDSASVFRRKRLARLLENASKQLVEAGIEPHAVKFPLLHDILDRGSVEDNDNLQDMWASLLANAAGGQTLVTTAFPDILKSLSTDEAVFLTLMFHGVDNNYTWNLDPVHYGNLRRLNLIVTGQEGIMPTLAVAWDSHAMRITRGDAPDELCVLTDLGWAFVNACTSGKAAKQT